MEYLDGLDLDRLVKEEGPLAPARAIHILAQVCGALAEAHALGLVHRDIKPANIVLTARIDEPDVVKVLDFGLVKTLEQNAGDSRAGAITGTPMYLAPEAIVAPETVDGRADIYALGAVAYFLLAGRNVFESDTVVGTLGMHVVAQPVTPSAHLAKSLPSDLEHVVLWCLAKERSERPASAEALLAALLSCEDAPRYDKAAAFRWWRERGATLRSSAARTTLGSSATMVIDLRGRNGAAALAVGEGSRRRAPIHS
jgi:serine/threonine protein kinase